MADKGGEVNNATLANQIVAQGGNYCLQVADYLLKKDSDNAR